MLASRILHAVSPRRLDHERRFGQLYRRELSFVWTILRRLGVEDDQVEDAAHDVFMVVHRQLEHFEGRSEERTWIYAITRRIAWRYRRAHRRRGRRRAALAAVGSVPVQLDDPLERREADELLAAFLETLDRPKREAFVLGELARMSRRSLGEALGVSPTTAYSRLRAARAEFEAAFGRGGPSAAVVVRRRARSVVAVPSDRRQRVWLALPGGLGMGGGTIVGVAGMVLVAIAWVHPVAKPVATPDSRAAVVSEARPAPTLAHAGMSAPPVLAESEPDRTPRPEPAVAPTLRRRPTARRARSEPQVAVASDQGERDAAKAPEAASVPSNDAVEHLAQEAAMLAEARAAMRAGQWGRAESALERHAQRFPTGRLSDERRRSRVTVACRMGDDPRARAEAAALLRASASPASRDWVRRSCIGKGESSRDGSFVRRARGGDQDGR